MSTLTGKLVGRSLIALGAALIAAGIGTAGLLYGIEVRSVDRALLAATAAFGHSREWQAEHVPSPVQVDFADRTDVPAEWIAAVLRTERPLFRSTPTQRILLALVEQQGDEDGDHEGSHDERHRVVVAYAPRPTFMRAVGPFSLAYGIAAMAVSLGAAYLLRALLLREVRPLARAVATIERAAGASVGTRIEAQGPDEIRTLLGAVDALLVRRDAAFLAQRRFVSLAAHELRTPVAAMLGEIDVALRKSRTTSDYTLVLTTVRDEVQSLAALVEGLLLLARVDAGQSEQNRSREHIVSLVAAAVQREQALIESNGGRLTVDASVDPEVEVHEALVIAAIGNLLRNAAVHAPGSAVHVRIERLQQKVRIAVEDDGPGLRGEVFERSEQGLGLGLPLAREIARRHGGDCEVLERARGCVVVMTLPIC